MPGYFEKLLHNFQHLQPNRPQRAPHYWTVPAYGSKVEYAQTEP